MPLLALCVYDEEAAGVVVLEILELLFEGNIFQATDLILLASAASSKPNKEAQTITIPAIGSCHEKRYQMLFFRIIEYITGISTVFKNVISEIRKQSYLKK